MILFTLTTTEALSDSCSHLCVKPSEDTWQCLCVLALCHVTDSHRLTVGIVVTPAGCDSMGIVKQEPQNFITVGISLKKCITLHLMWDVQETRVLSALHLSLGTIFVVVFGSLCFFSPRFYSDKTSFVLRVAKSDQERGLYPHFSSVLRSSMETGHNTFLTAFLKLTPQINSNSVMLNILLKSICSTVFASVPVKTSFRDI